MQKLLIVIGGVVLITVGCFYAYLYALGSAWTLNKPDKRPFFITTEPIVVKKIIIPKGTKVIYDKQFFWEKYEQKEPLNEEDIIEISIMNGSTIDWGGIPVNSMVKFYNSEMKGYSVNADFRKLEDYRKTEFSNLWQSCNSDLGITVKQENDWSFNKENISDVQSCGVIYQRYFVEDAKQQSFLDSLHTALMKTD